LAGLKFEGIFATMNTRTKCVFLDRDGVLNKDNPAYTFRVEDFKILPGVIDALASLKKSGFLLVVVTNQSGIAKGIYSQIQMEECHHYFQKECGSLIDHFYFSPYHRTVTESLLTKPGTLMFEKAIARFNIDIQTSWMIGDRGRDIIPARALGIKTIQIGDEVEPENLADYKVDDLQNAARIILTK
jgi:D-glycero-D-manno-heptose 1,7-bisphosphate phosphatase